MTITQYQNDLTSKALSSGHSRSAKTQKFDGLDQEECKIKLDTVDDKKYGLNGGQAHRGSGHADIENGLPGLGSCGEYDNKPHGLSDCNEASNGWGGKLHDCGENSSDSKLHSCGRNGSNGELNGCGRDGSNGELSGCGRNSSNGELNGCSGNGSNGELSGCGINRSNGELNGCSGNGSSGELRGFGECKPKVPGVAGFNGIDMKPIVQNSQRRHYENHDCDYFNGVVTKHAVQNSQRREYESFLLNI